MKDRSNGLALSVAAIYIIPDNYIKFHARTIRFISLIRTWLLRTTWWKKRTYSFYRLVSWECPWRKSRVCFFRQTTCDNSECIPSRPHHCKWMVNESKIRHNNKTKDLLSNFVLPLKYWTSAGPNFIDLLNQKILLKNGLLIAMSRIPVTNCTYKVFLLVTLFW